MQITEKMVEAAAQALYGAEMARERRTTLTLSGAAGKPLAPQIEPYDESADTCWRPDARAALTAAFVAQPTPVYADVERALDVLADHEKVFHDEGNHDREQACREAARLLRTLSADAKRSEEHRNDLYDKVVSLRTEVSALRERIAEVQKARDAVRQYAHNIATWLYDKKYAATAPDWKPLPDVMGLLTQIDSMVASLPDDIAALAAATARAETAERERDEARAAVKRARSNALMVEHEQDAAHTSIVKRMNQAFRERDTATARAERAEAMLRECSETLRKIVKVGTREEFERFVGGYEKIVTVSEEAEIAAAIVSRLTAPAAPTEGGADD